MGKTHEMRTHLLRLAAVAGLAVVVAVPGALGRSHAAGPVIVSFGDSIAAGEGSGDDHGYPDNPAAYSAVLGARLGGSSYNFSITGACAAAGQTAAAGTDASECRVSKSIMTTQIPAARKLGPASADIVTITVGADDIHFAECFRALVFTLGAPGTPGGPDPCAPAQLTTHLQALAANLGTVLTTVRSMYPGAKIAVTGYGNVIPRYVDSRPQSLCSAVDYLYAYELYKKGGVKALAVPLLTRTFDKQVGAYQESLYLYAAGVLQQLNGTIRSVAAANRATFVPLNLAGHDFCEDYATNGWVFAPQAVGKVSVSWHGLGPSRSFDFRPHTLCVPQQPAPACNVTAPLAVAGKKSVKVKIAVISARATVSYSFNAVLNDFPHLTATGQAALAANIRSKLGL